LGPVLVVEAEPSILTVVRYHLESAGFEIPAEYVPPQGFGRDWIFPEGLALPPNYNFGCMPGEEPEMLMLP
jgi:hypothetical protein